MAAQAEMLWDEALPIEVRELPEDLAALDELLSGPGLLAPFVEHWQREATSKFERVRYSWTSWWQARYSNPTSTVFPEPAASAA